MFSLWRDFWKDPRQSRFTVPLLVINVLGSVYGYFWYREQLAETPFYLWPFVPDSPLSSTLFAAALLLHLSGATRTLFQVLACTVSIKYGIWAVIMITNYWFSGGPVAPTETMLWLSHLGMAAEGAIFLKTYRFGIQVVMITGAWMLVNDLMDYGAGLHPYLFMAGQDILAMVAALALTALLTAGLSHLGRSDV
ncbi:MAG: DUF1405 domain-containing protein [Desulfotomaculaceae bacterium]|nr:DUF1405 domain-containing protein [Desulfotomaculaceae bacterium]